ncbi:TylF/MycF/NovP-related O-methyltransferase [Candidatus Regiella insecticola]|uniref:TylF/MycF/NovP-related O-methyltransferase n=1 Tax=Candidatus Regiella insecticola TaxID=138073 RepID=UPI001596D6A8|nr:TylF/MycF/NovP-related O-methyltransferase [Candidatus Regiella insecticola]
MKGVAPLWEKDSEFISLYKRLNGSVLLDKSRAYTLYQLAKRQSDVEGDYLELGAYRCGTTLLMASQDNLAKKTIFILDSFEGLPTVSNHDPYWVEGDIGTVNLDEILQFLSANLTKNINYKIIKGFFPNQIDLDALNRTFSFIHIDTDLYQPTLDGLNFFYTKLSPGGVILVDDFGNMSCPGVEKAVKEFSEVCGVKYIFLYTGQALFIK